MPGKIKVKILAGRNLPVMDRSGDTTDAYVEIKFGNTTYKTDVCRKTLNPQWNSEWYRFEVDDAELQDEPLQIRLMDHDTYSANDAIGKVYLNLNPLLLPGLPLTVKNIWTLEATMNSSTGSQGGSAMTGWIPVYDTMHGIRGEVNVIVKVELFSDFNKFRQSSCGVQFFYSSNVPHGYHAQVIHGFVEELIVSDDPEYKWIDKIRTPRASNEARQTLFFKISGEVQRKIGLKALDLGGNAVIGYIQNFDLEGESGIVARGIGTAVTLIKLQDIPTLPLENPNVDDLACFSFQNKRPQDYSGSDSSLPLLSQSPKNSPVTRSPVKIRKTQVGNKFPHCEPVPRPRIPMRVSEYRASAMKARQLSLQSSPLAKTRNNYGIGSSQSLSDELMCESSMRSLLELEDMRGERTSAFSRGLKNLKYLPKRVIQMRSRFSDSFDDESDQDSTYSSTWSVQGSDSARSSIVDIRQSIRRKRFTHKKNPAESSIAAMLIRSVHTGFPLDSVREDRETPTPSPVNFLGTRSELSEHPLRHINKFEEVMEEANEDDATDASNIFVEKSEELYNYNDNKCNIPMISSSETDTSTSEDEPSESSTNYNILDDSFNAIESCLPGHVKLLEQDSLNIADSCEMLNFIEKKIEPTIDNDISNVAEGFKETAKNFHQDSMPEGLILDMDRVPDVFTPLIPSAPSSPDCEVTSINYSRLPAAPTPSPRNSPSFKLKYLSKQENFDSNDDGYTLAGSSVEEETPSLHELASTPILFDSPTSVEPYMEPLTASLIDLTSDTNVLEFLTPEKDVKSEIVSVLGKDELNSSTGSIEVTKNAPEVEEKDVKSKIADSSENLPPYKKYLHQKASVERQTSLESKLKSRKVSRTDTVIYKGPLIDPEKPIEHKNSAGKILKSPLSPIIIVAPPSDPDNHLRVPMAETKDINVHSPYPLDSAKPGDCDCTPDDCLSPQALSDGPQKYRQHCMLDLLKTIDAKMMVHVDRKDSSRKKRRDKANLVNATPSPDSIRKSRSHRRNSRSKSPEKHHHHHHHHSHHGHGSSSPHPTSPLALISTSSPPLTPVPSHHLVTENIPLNNLAQCLSDAQPSCSRDIIPSSHEIVAKQLAANPKECRVSENLAIPMNPVKIPAVLLSPSDLDPSVHKSHSDGSLGKLKCRLTNNTNSANITDDPCVPCSPVSPRQQEEQQPASPGLPASVGAKVTNSPAAKTPLHRRSSDSDLSITPKGNSLAGSDRSVGHMRPSTAIVRTMNQDALEMLEYPFITILQYPSGFILNLGGLVSARSVKLIERISNIEEPEGRDAWWKEIRMEVRSHARALGCNVVLGYKEEISICEDVCVLNASGTAAVINLLNTSQDQDVLLNKSQQSAMTSSLETDKIQRVVGKAEKTDDIPVMSQNHSLIGKIKPISEVNDHDIIGNPFQVSCNLCHLPYNESSVPFKVDVSKCAICRRAKVPDVLFTTIELPENIPTTGRGVFLQATVCKCKRDLRGELNAKEISDCLPFLEYELHSLLLNKLKIKGMNAIFGLKVQISIGERLIIGMAVGTAVFLTALPTPCIPKIASGNSWYNEEQLADVQKIIIDNVKKNRELYHLKSLADMENGRSAASDTDESDDDLPDLDLGLGTKDACVLEVDDVEDMDRINLLLDEIPPDGFHIVNTQSIPGLEDLEIVRNLQMFTQISRAKIPSSQLASMPAKYFAKMLQTVFFKLRRMVPCALCDMQFKVALPEPDEIQFSVVGMALGLGEPTRINKYKRKGLSGSSSKDVLKKSDENDLIFNLDEDHLESSTVVEPINPATRAAVQNSSPLASQSQRTRPRSPFKARPHPQHRPKHVPLKERYGVDITPLSYLPGGKIERYLGNLNFFFIRESTSIREIGGLSGFTHTFITDILAIVRAQITALGGNAMVAFFMTQCVLLHSPHKNQGQCLVNVGGDVVSVSYFGDEKHNQNC